MNLDLSQNNKVHISGVIAESAQLFYEKFGENFYVITVEVRRNSSNSDFIPVTISERITSPEELVLGERVDIIGQYRSYNNSMQSGKRLVLSIFAQDVSFDVEEDFDINEIILNGFICKKPMYRVTPFGREIGDVMLAVNRAFGKSDYIPCILWGRNARYSQEISVGDNMVIYGRIQSRKYNKKIGEEEFEERVAYEVSTSKVEVVATKAEG